MSEEILREVRETRAKVVEVGHAIEMHDGRAKGFSDRLGERITSLTDALERNTEAVTAALKNGNGADKRHPLLEPGVVLWLILVALLAGGTEGVKGILALFGH